MTLFQFTVMLPLQKRERKHTTFNRFVLAESAQAALQLLRNAGLVQDGWATEFKVLADSAEPGVLDLYTMARSRTPEEFQRAMAGDGSAPRGKTNHE